MEHEVKCRIHHLLYLLLSKRRETAHWIRSYAELCINGKQHKENTNMCPSSFKKGKEMCEIAVVDRMVHGCELHTTQFEIITLCFVSMGYIAVLFHSLPPAATANRATERQGIMLMYFPVCRLLWLLSAQLSDSVYNATEKRIDAWFYYGLSSCSKVSKLRCRRWRLHAAQGYADATQSAGTN
jgi:hypothetical protein